MDRTRITSQESRCPGCGLRMPVSTAATYDGYYNAFPECWSVYTEVLGAEFSNAVLFGQVHQLTVDAYAVQHAGAEHPDKSVGIHLTGLCLVLERGVLPVKVSPLHQRLAGSIDQWPHFTPPEQAAPLTAFDVALSENDEEHAKTVRRWAEEVWDTWSAHHAEVARFLRFNLGPLHECRRYPAPSRSRL